MAFYVFLQFSSFFNQFPSKFLVRVVAATEKKAVTVKPLKRKKL